MSGHGHMTDRTDWTYVAECSEHGDDHLRVVASARAAAEEVADPSEVFPVDECPGCGAEMAFIQETEPTEVLD